MAAAVRETEEEAGVRVQLTGILRIEYEPCKLPRRPYQRMRVIFLACPVNPGQLPKSIPNYEVSCRCVSALHVHEWSL